MSEIRIYVEGAGKRDKSSRARLREGFREFLRAIYEAASRKRVSIRTIPSGSRNETYKDFRLAVETHPDAFNVLLVDSERPVSDPDKPREHLLRPPDKWDLSMCADENCHLMIQMMESWFLADVEEVAKYFGDGFNPNPIPKHGDVEGIPKDDVRKAIEDATRGVASKGGRGPYHKGRHSAELLRRIRPAKVCAAASGCRRLFAVLDEKVDANIPWR